MPGRCWTLFALTMTDPVVAVPDDIPGAESKIKALADEVFNPLRQGINACFLPYSIGKVRDACLAIRKHFLALEESDDDAFQVCK